VSGVVGVEVDSTRVEVFAYVTVAGPLLVTVNE
jgi:hypothetical protein